MSRSDHGESDRHSGALLTDAIREAIGSDVDIDLVCPGMRGRGRPYRAVPRSGQRVDFDMRGAAHRHAR